MDKRNTRSFMEIHR